LKSRTFAAAEDFAKRVNDEVATLLQATNIHPED